MDKKVVNIKIGQETWVMLKKKKVEIEGKLKRRVTWDEFFRMIIMK
jgi:hypothetical protein